MKALTYRGTTEFPIDIKIFAEGDLIGAQPGDLIVSAFMHEGNYYACWEAKVASNGSCIGKGLGDSELPAKTGFAEGETVYYFIYRNGEYLDVYLLASYQKNSITLWQAEIGDQPIQVFDNPYYSLDPVWPDIDFTVTPYEQIPTSKYADRHLWNYIQWSKYFPQHVQNTTVTLLSGKGKFYPSKYTNTLGYWFKDQTEKEVKFLIKCTPLKNSRSADNERVLILKW